jgi:hypothetical protein
MADLTRDGSLRIVFNDALRVSLRWGLLVTHKSPRRTLVVSMSTQRYSVTPHPDPAYPYLAGKTPAPAEIRHRIPMETIAN